MNPAGRAFLPFSEYQPPHGEPDEEYPLSYTTGRTVYHFHTRTKTNRARQLRHAAPDAWIEMAPDDARPLGIEEGDIVRVEARRGAIEVRVRISDIKPGLVFAPFHYGYWDTAEKDAPDGRPRAANELPITEWDPVSKQPYYKVEGLEDRALLGVVETCEGETTRQINAIKTRMKQAAPQTLIVAS